MKALVQSSWLAALALLLAGCLTEPGRGRKAEAGYHAAAPVIAALEKYHADRKRYPANLGELVPAYLPNAAALRALSNISPASKLRADAFPRRPGNTAFDQFWYQTGENTFSLWFQYSGPGLNTCTYDSTTKQWTASGYY